MTRQQQLIVLGTYESLLKDWAPVRADRNLRSVVDNKTALQHAHWMVKEMHRRLEEDAETSPGQADRWIGFVQGILWACGFCAITDLVAANTQPL